MTAVLKVFTVAGSLLILAVGGILTSHLEAYPRVAAMPPAFQSADAA